MPISRNVARLALAGALAASSLGLSAVAVASEGGSGGGHTPAIKNTSMANGEEGGIAITVGATRAKRVVVTVGEGSTRERVELSRAERQNKLVLWEGTLSDRKEQCARVIMAAVNSHGRDERAEKVCIFGEAEPEPPGTTLPLP